MQRRIRTAGQRKSLSEAAKITGVGMGTTLNRLCLEVLHSESVKDFARINVEFAHEIGFLTVSATVITDHSPNLTEFSSVTNAPSGYLPAFEDMESAKLDPVAQHCKLQSSQIIWDQELYVTSGQGHIWEHQAAFGYKSGICMAFHLPHGRHFMFGVDSDRTVCATKRELYNLTYDIRLFAAHAQAAAFDLYLPYVRTNGENLLARSELDALRRSMDGLSNFEVGRAMGISETDVLLRIRRAMKKLGCATKYEAALRAIRLGLVKCD